MTLGVTVFYGVRLRIELTKPGPMRSSSSPWGGNRVEGCPVVDTRVPGVGRGSCEARERVLDCGVMSAFGAIIG